jgi:chromosome segregation ATPase
MSVNPCHEADPSQLAMCEAKDLAEYVLELKKQIKDTQDETNELYQDGEKLCDIVTQKDEKIKAVSLKVYRHNRIHKQFGDPVELNQLVISTTKTNCHLVQQITKAQEKLGEQHDIITGLVEMRDNCLEALGLDSDDDCMCWQKVQEAIEFLKKSAANHINADFVKEIEELKKDKDERGRAILQLQEKLDTGTEQHLAREKKTSDYAMKKIKELGEEVEKLKYKLQEEKDEVEGLKGALERAEQEVDMWRNHTVTVTNINKAE